MKKLILSLLFLNSIFNAFSQSQTIFPNSTVSDASGGDQLKLIANSPFIGVQGIRFNGTPTSRTAVTSGNDLFRLGANGNHITGSNSVSESGIINFKATQNWNATSRGTSIVFGTTPNNAFDVLTRIIINHNGNVGVGTTAPTSLLHVFGDGSTDPLLRLHNNNTAAAGIRFSNSTVSKWDIRHINSTNPASNLFFFENDNSVIVSTPLILTGEGDAVVERNLQAGGFTRLGTGAPNIKMKQLSGAFSASANTIGTPTSIVHGVAVSSKIISINVLGQYLGSGGYVSNSFLTSNGYQFDYQVDGVNIIVTPKIGNSASLVGQNIKILITYIE